MTMMKVSTLPERHRQALIDDLRQSLDADPEQAGRELQEAEIFLLQLRLDDAERVLLDYAGSDACTARGLAYLHLSRVYSEKGDLDAALRALAEAQRDPGFEAAALAEEAAVHVQMGSYETASAQLSRAEAALGQSDAVVAARIVELDHEIRAHGSVVDPAARIEAIAARFPAWRAYLEETARNVSSGQT